MKTPDDIARETADAYKRVSEHSPDGLAVYIANAIREYVKQEQPPMASDLKSLIGKTLTDIEHIERENTDDRVLMTFDDGSTLELRGAWCNNSTGAIDVTVKATA